MAKGQRALLPPEDEERLKQLAESGTGALQHRARAILAWHEGLTASETAKRTKLTVNQIQYLWRLYRTKGLDLFLVDTEPILADLPSGPVLSEPEDTRLSLETLCANYRVDLSHAQHVGALALQIFDATNNMHRLPQNVRSLLEAAALVHNIAYEIDPPNHHIRGRDILMAQPLRHFTDDERRILACTTSFHRKKVRPEAEPVYMELPEELRRDALALSAILRVADGLDDSQTQSTRIADVQIGSGEVVIVVDGPQARTDIEQAQKKADLWNRVFAVQVRLVTTLPEVELEPEPEPAFKLATPSESNAAITVVHIGRTAALRTLDRLETLFRYVRADDMSSLPALARETHRLIDALALVNLKAFGKEARWLADLVEEAYLAIAVAERVAALGDEGGATATAAARSWKDQARAAIQAIDAGRYTELVNGLRAVLMEKIGVDDRMLLAYQIGPLLWEQLSELRRVMEHGSDVREALGAAYRLQDYLLSFREFLGPEVAQVLDILAPLESYLAAIQMTQAVLTRLEPKTVKKGRKTVTLSADPASETLRTTQVELLEMLADNLPAIWTGVNSVVFRRSFGLAVAVP